MSIAACRGWALLLPAALLLLSGCVERKLRITSDPPGARVFVNDEEAGTTPLKVSFLWYGDYDLVFRKSGYSTVKTSYRVQPPWWQVPPFDLVSEALILGTLHDEHEVPPVTLLPAEPPVADEVVERALDTRDRTLFQEE